MKLIGARELTEASHAHIDRTAPIGPRPIHRIVESIGVDGDEFQAMAQAIADQREPERIRSSRGTYAAGLVDGFVIGVRAAQAAHSTTEEES